MTARVEDTVAYQDRHGNPIADLYEVVDVSGFYVKEGDKDSKSKAYVQVYLIARKKILRIFSLTKISERSVSI